MAANPGNGVDGSPLRIFISAGEPSGDRQAAALVEALRRHHPNLQVMGVGGKALAQVGTDIWLNNHAAAVIGLVASLAKAPVLIPKLTRVLKRLAVEKPDLAILVDWGGANVRIAHALKRITIPVLYYFPPRSWDRRAHRDIATIVDAIATPFPWSKHILSGARARVEWVGHPLVDQVKPTVTPEVAAGSIGLDRNRSVVALLPGSRSAEVSHCLPVLLDAAKRIVDQYPDTQFLLPATDETRRQHPQLVEDARQQGLTLFMLHGMDYNILQCADAAAAVSGTALLELALLGIPMVVVYRGSFLTWLQYEIFRRTIMHIRFIGIPNLIADRKIVPELLQWQATPENIAHEVLSLLGDDNRRQKMKEELASACRQLGPPGATERTAEMALDLAAYGHHERFATQIGIGIE